MQANDISFKGLVVAVIGGGRGIGRQYCLDLAKAGATVVAAGPSKSSEAVAALVRENGGAALAVQADARDGESIIRQVLEAHGRVDALVINSGIVRDRSFAKMTAEEWDEVISVNLTGSFSCARAAWPVMASQGGGAILFTTSGAGMHGNFGQANYAAAKAGIIGLCKTLAIEGRRSGIRVNAIAPMATTDMTKSVLSEEMLNALTVEQVSAVALALIHPKNRATGTVIEAGGGWAGAMRWERSLGIWTDRASPAQFLENWESVMDFSAGSDHPISTADSLNAATYPQERLNQDN